MEHKNLTKQDIDTVINITKDLYLADSIPWVIGYSGGKDSTATVQIVWNALNQLAPHERQKTVYIISNDTLVESPVVAAWLSQSLNRMKKAAAASGLPIEVHQLKPDINDTFWVNLIGRGYPYPRRNMRWCTDRLKIGPTNRFVEHVISRAGEAIMVLGTRKAESSARRHLMENYEKQRVREHLNPSSTMPNAYVYTPLEEWSSDNVWQYLMQYPNIWGQSNKELLAMYSGASADGECPLVTDSSTPSCGNSRFGCWICTMVSEDKSMAAMIQNDEEKAWMLPLLDFRNDIGAEKELDVKRRDFRRMDGKLYCHGDKLVHGPYTKETREYFLRKLLEVELYVKECGPAELAEHPLIQMEELRKIRQIWVTEKHEFDDSLPRIYREVTGRSFDDSESKTNRYFGSEEWEVLQAVCEEHHPSEQLLLSLCSSLLDIESQYSMMASRRGINADIENAIRRCFYQDEDDALTFYKTFHPTEDITNEEEEASAE